MEKARSFETSANFYRTTWRHIPEYSILHYHVHNRPLLDPILSQMNPVHTSAPYFLKISTDIILLAMILLLLTSSSAAASSLSSFLFVHLY
jgi:hypothetical protein